MRLANSSGKRNAAGVVVQTKAKFTVLIKRRPGLQTPRRLFAVFMTVSLLAVLLAAGRIG